MLARDYHMPYRQAHEVWAAGAWAVGFVAFAYHAATGVVPLELAGLVSLLCLAMCVKRLAAAANILTYRSALAGVEQRVLDFAELEKRADNPDQVYLGEGFVWQPQHSQRLYDLQSIDLNTLTVPAAVRGMLGTGSRPFNPERIGEPWLHGVEPFEGKLSRPLQNFEGGTLVVGTTQGGKGVTLVSLVVQAIRRGDVVVILDPKNSSRLDAAARWACKRYRRPGTFLEFHPAFPERGARLNFFHSFQKPTELASRVKEVLPPSGDETFASFAWDAVNVPVQAMCALGIAPTLKRLTSYVETGYEPLLAALLIQLYDRVLGIDWQYGEVMQRLRNVDKPKLPTPLTTPELLAHVVYYEQHLPEHLKDKTVDSLVRVYRHSREHWMRITASLLPTLQMLTSGALGKSLSPDPFDFEDKRPIMNFEKIEEGNHVLLMKLDSLPDPTVATAIASLALADAAARAGIRYNLGIKRRISFFIDEASNVINSSCIELLNKGAESGVSMTLLLQTIPDLAERLGSVDAAHKALGNLNNVIALRTICGVTQEYLATRMGFTGIHSGRAGLNEGADTHVTDFAAGVSSQVTEARSERIPSDIFGRLPNGEFFALAGAVLHKGRAEIFADTTAANAASLGSAFDVKPPVRPATQPASAASTQSPTTTDQIAA